MAGRMPAEHILIEHVREWCKGWQKVLRLEDFDIHVRYAERCELRDCNAMVLRSSDGTYASIILMPREWCDRESYANHDLETDLVHELLHVREIWDGESEWRRMKDECSTLFRIHEAGLQRTAEALVGLKRGRF